MSRLQEVIERIAIYAEQNNFKSCLSGWMEQYYFLHQSHGSKKSLEELSSDEIAEILSYMSRDVEPQLNFDKITEVTKDYPFYLPLEIYELYSKGNGCLPIGLDTVTNSKSKKEYLNYFAFPGGDEIGFKPLHQCIDFYNSLADLKKEYKTAFDLHWFPVAFFEDWIVAVIGSEKQQATSPIISFYDGDLDIRGKSKIEWSNLTNMLSAWIEINEKGLHQSKKDNKSKIKAICKKYGCGSPNRAIYIL